MSVQPKKVQEPEAAIEPSSSMVLQAADWYVQLHAPECTEAERAAFDAWLKIDAAHGVAYERMEKMWSNLHEVIPAPALNALEQVLTPEFKPVRSRLSVKSLALGISLVVGAWLGSQSGTASYLMADYSTAVGEQRVVELPDHSRITLNTYSAIDIDYSNKQRRIHLLQGEVLVEVAKDAARPFIVATRQGTARALGTQFVVKREIDATKVGVIESVGEACTLKRMFSNAPPECVTLHTGQGTHIENEHINQPSDIDVSAIAGWANGTLAVDDQSLADVLLELERYRHGRIHFNAEDIAHLRVSGVLPLNDTDRALDMLTTYLPVDVKNYTQFFTVVTPR
ncbi:FecR family protein [Methylobacillus gramineus]|uniref:FecR family protein n=1 Tax=Methylobacillus gramineus TaxID=755169 RepID=UPI001CFFD40D|nr:FecR family protein [Methylobacillus gramineus]MCB5184765.1 FecR family protein [Methylobacillus gramineus]